MGGGSPVEAIRGRRAEALGGRVGVPAFAGMKHSPPFIAEAAAEAREAGVERLIGLPLAPHYARMSVGQYDAALMQAWSGPPELVAGFHHHPALTGATSAVPRDGP